MARIKDASVAEVKAAADIVDVVSARTSLRRASSSRFTGRCPFHEERTPSFSVDPVDKLYYCFGCGKGGDVVRFDEIPRGYVLGVASGNEAVSQTDSATH